MKLEILGSGCKRCQQLAENTKSAVRALGLDAEVVKVEDMASIVGYGIMATPALVVDGQVKVSGKVPSVDELKSILKPAAN